MKPYEIMEGIYNVGMPNDDGRKACMKYGKKIGRTVLEWMNEKT